MTYTLTKYFGQINRPTTQRLRGKKAAKAAALELRAPALVDAAELLDEDGIAVGVWYPKKGWKFAKGF